MTMRINEMGGVVGAVIAALGLAAGCGDGFASGDCRESRTCSSSAGDGAHGGEDGNDMVAGGAGGNDATSVGGSGATAGASEGLGGAAGASGAGGAGGAEGECRVDADCSNNVPDDGEEACEAGACVDGNPPPTIVSITPESDAVDVEPDTKIVIEFSEPLDPETVSNIQLLDGTTVVPGEFALADGETVTFTPASPLALLAPYTVSVGTDVTDEAGAPLLAAQSSTFTVRDGAWTTVEVIDGRLTELSDQLPMTSTGRTLLSWTGNGASRCPITAGWFLRGENTVLKTFVTNEQSECNRPSSGGNAAGVAGVAWSVPAAVDFGVVVQQYRAEAWLAPPRLVSENRDSSFRLAVAPSGAMTLFEHDSAGTVARTTNSAGAWPAAGTPLSAYTVPRGKASVAFDSDGKGWAVWAAKDPGGTMRERIVASRLATATGKWATATDLPGSVTTTDGDGQRGEPVVAVDGEGNGLALWVDASSSGKLMASRFVQSAWAQPEVVSGALLVDVVGDAPALVFDGEAFVAAWSAQEAGKRYVYTARYDLTTGWDSYHKQQSATDSTSAKKMPRLVSDGRGNLLLVYVSGTDPDYTLRYQRYAGDAWSEIALVPDGSVSAPYFEDGHPLPLSMSGNGLAALAWANHDENGDITTIQLASFF